MRRFRKATIKDVANHAGVSTTTVSYFVSGRESVCSPETGQRIREAIEALQYTPNSLTSGLRQRATHTIGVCMIHPLDPEVGFGAPYFERLMRGVMYEADIVKYGLLRYHAEVRQSPMSDVFLDGRVDGLIFDQGHHRHAARLANAGMPTVVVACSRSLLPEVAGVYANEAMTTDLALSHLWDLGHRRIAHVAGHMEDVDGVMSGDDVAIGRFEAYCDWMRERSIFDPSLIGYANSWEIIQQPEIMASWYYRKDRPTAIFCANDALAIFAMDMARQLGWRVPEELSVIGVDNFSRSFTCTPPLTTVDVPMETIGRKSVQALINLIHGAPVEQCRVCVPVTDLVVRASTASVAA